MKCLKILQIVSIILKNSIDLSVEILDTGQYEKTGVTLHDDCEDENEHSVVCKLTYKNNTYSFIAPKK